MQIKNSVLLFEFIINVSGMTFRTPPCFIAVVANSKIVVGGSIYCSRANRGFVQSHLVVQFAKI